MSEVKLTKQSEAILEKLRGEAQFTPDERDRIRKGLMILESVGILGGFIIKVAAVVAAAVALVQWFRWDK